MTEDEFNQEWYYLFEAAIRPGGWCALQAMRDLQEIAPNLTRSAGDRTSDRIPATQLAGGEVLTGGYAARRTASSLKSQPPMRFQLASV
jgi:hypothetical protein